MASLQWSSPLVLAQEETTTTEEAPKIPNDELDSLVAPIALYPDAMLAQTLAASTYPLEVMQLDQWMDKNKNLKDKALADAVAKQPWDPSVQGWLHFQTWKSDGRKHSVDDRRRQRFSGAAT